VIYAYNIYLQSLCLRYSHAVVIQFLVFVCRPCTLFMNKYMWYVENVNSTVLQDSP